MTHPESRRFGVVRYPTYYVVIDKADDNNKIVFESRSRDTAHSHADKLNREVDEAKQEMLAALMHGRLLQAGVATSADAERLTVDQRDAILQVAAWGGDEDATWALALALFDG